MKICAVIPAAGRATRLGAVGPKILMSITPAETIWSILYEKLVPLVDHIDLILSPDGSSTFPALPKSVSVSIQQRPVGMGDAIFCGFDVWSHYDAVLIVWGDQVFVSNDTLTRALTALRSMPKNHVVLPVTRLDNPYVEYLFEENRLTNVLQSREGDIVNKNGFSDVGTFLLTTHGLYDAWIKYLESHPRGDVTGEINFLPFLPFLSKQGWLVTHIEVADPTEARGINTKEDLLFFRKLYDRNS